MVSSMKAVASLDVELTVEERNLLSVAYKNVIGARRASWRIVSSIEQKEENKAAEDKLKLIRTYREKVRALHSRRNLQQINLPNLLVMPLITFMKAFPRESFLPTN